MERGSVIDAQQTLIEEIAKEIDRCKDWRYWYVNYARVVKENGEMVPAKHIIDLRFNHKVYGGERKY